MNNFIYKQILPITKDTTKYRFITSDHINISNFKNKKILEISYEGLKFISEKAFTDISHLLRTSHLKLLKKILEDPNASENDKYVALEFLKNADISSKFEFPMCQDTGTAIVIGKKGQQVWTNFCDKEAISEGIYNAYTKGNLRYSQNAPLSMYNEENTNNNLPAQIDLYATETSIYEFIFIAKGGGSANKTFLFQETKAILSPDILLNFISSKIKKIGTSACPPYHLAIVIGGTSAEFNLKTVKLASAGYLDYIPLGDSKASYGFRDVDFENKVLNISRDLNIGAQFGGKYFCHDVRVIRLPRHGASCPIGIGVSCSADRNIKAKITKKGMYLEDLERNPSKFITKTTEKKLNIVHININKPMIDICKELTKYPIATKLKLTGNIIVARDIAHAHLNDRLKKTGDLPSYFKNHIIYYAGPAKTPMGFPSGSFGPTTAGRMDLYLPKFQSKGASLITLAKGNRSKTVVESCKKNKGFYLGSIGGAAAIIGKNYIKKVELIEYPNLGMEAIFLIEVHNFPAFIIIDDKGNDFFSKLL